MVEEGKGSMGGVVKGGGGSESTFEIEKRDPGVVKDGVADGA
jgi:hypothetical protein